MSKIVQNNRERTRDEEYDFEEASYVLPPQGPSAETWKSHDQGDPAHGEMRKPDVYETEHHVYSTPFRYENVELRHWSEGERTLKGRNFWPTWAASPSLKSNLSWR